MEDGQIPDLKNLKKELRSYYTVGTSRVLSIPATLAHELQLDKKGYINVSYATFDHTGIIIFTKHVGDSSFKNLESFDETGDSVE